MSLLASRWNAKAVLVTKERLPVREFRPGAPRPALRYLPMPSLVWEARRGRVKFHMRVPCWDGKRVFVAGSICSGDIFVDGRSRRLSPRCRSPWIYPRTSGSWVKGQGDATFSDGFAGTPQPSDRTMLGSNTMGPHCFSMSCRCACRFSSDVSA